MPVENADGIAIIYLSMYIDSEASHVFRSLSVLVALELVDVFLIIPSNLAMHSNSRRYMRNNHLSSTVNIVVSYRRLWVPCKMRVVGVALLTFVSSAIASP